MKGPQNGTPPNLWQLLLDPPDLLQNPAPNHIGNAEKSGQRHHEGHGQDFMRKAEQPFLIVQDLKEGSVPPQQ